MPKEFDFENLRNCLDWYSASSIYIRDCGGIRENGKYDLRGMTKINENLENRKLDFEKDDSGLHLIIDSDKVFHFPLKNYYKGFSLAYDRIEETGKMIMLSHGVDPYDENLPEPRRSFLRTDLDDHLVEISFSGRINLKFHSWFDKPHLKYWMVDRPGNMAEIILKQQIEYGLEDSC